MDKTYKTYYIGESSQDMFVSIGTVSILARYQAGLLSKSGHIDQFIPLHGLNKLVTINPVTTFPYVFFLLPR